MASIIPKSYLTWLIKCRHHYPGIPRELSFLHVLCEISILAFHVAGFGVLDTGSRRRLHSPGVYSSDKCRVNCIH